MVLLALDQGTKYLAVTHLKDRPSVKIWPGVFELQYLENRGAAFGILQDGKLFFVFAAIVMLTVIAFILVKTPKGKKIQNLAYPADVYCSGRNRQYDRQTQTGLCG